MKLTKVKEKFLLKERSREFNFKSDDALAFFFISFITGFFNSDPNGAIEIYYRHTDDYHESLTIKSIDEKQL